VERRTASQPYNNGVDIWGLGLCGYHFFGYQTHLWHELDEKEYRKVKKRLSAPSRMVNPLLYLVSAISLQMLALNSSERVSAAESLTDETFRKAEVGEESADRLSGTSEASRKRQLEPQVLLCISFFPYTSSSSLSRDNLQYILSYLIPSHLRDKKACTCGFQQRCCSNIFGDFAASNPIFPYITASDIHGRWVANHCEIQYSGLYSLQVAIALACIQSWV
jgi:serine/threonine protein kinase